MYEDAQSTTWTVIPGNGVQVTPTSGTGNGTFTMTFAQNTSTTASATRIATVRSGGVDHNVTITQLPLKFSITPAEQTVLFNATTATVTIYAEEGKAWTASVSGPTGTNPLLSSTTGEGTQTVTVTIPANTTTSQREYTVTATMTNPNATVTATITQRRTPNTSATFNVNNFTFNGSNRTGAATSGDEYVSISLTNVGNDYANYWDQGYGPSYFGYIVMGYSTGGGYYSTPNQGIITITPVAGVKITGITVTYSSNDYGSYDTNYNPSVSVTPGSYTRNGSTGTWTGTSTGAVTFTNGYRNNYGNYYFPRITGIVVTYEPI